MFERLHFYLKGGQHAARNQYQQPEVHVEELGDFISHVNWENQQQETHAEAADVFPHTPAKRRPSTGQKTQAMPFT